MTQLRDFRDAVIGLLTADATFTAAIAALLGVAVSTAIKTNRPLNEIPATLYPCWVFELGDGHAASITNDSQDYQTIGLSQQSFVNDTKLALVWMDNDRDHAGDVRCDVPYYLTQLFLRNPQPAGCEAVTLTDWQPDRAANHPVQIWRATLQSMHSFPRSG